MDTCPKSTDTNPPQQSYSASNMPQRTLFECKPKRSSRRRHKPTGKRHRPRSRPNPHRSGSSSSQTDSPMQRPSSAYRQAQEVSDRPMSFGNPSQYNRFWETYGRARQWQHSHQILYWKSRAITLENENNELRTCFVGLSNLCQPNVEQCIPGRFGPIQQNTFPEYYATNYNLQGQMGEQANNFTYSPTSTGTVQPNTKQFEATRPGSSRYKTPENSDGTPSYFCKESNMIGEKIDSSYLSTVAENDENDESFEFEINEEMMAFLEQSMKHKLELSEQRKRERLESEKKQRQDEYESSLPPQHICKQRIAEMKLLYGEGAPKIIAMETSVKLSFERRLQQHNSQLWPVIPLRP